MKTFLKKILQYILKILAKAVLNKYQPNIVGITGSVGKTSTKEAIYAVLASKFRVRRNYKNYNNEIGVPLSILGFESGNKSFWNWFLIFIKSLGLIFSKASDYPQILVLEMGADRPGDLEYLVKLVSCQIGVVTAVGPVHLEFFKKIENIEKEKRILVTHLKSDSWAILNRDDEMVYPMAYKTKAKVLTYGFSKGADIQASDLVISNRLQEENQQEITGTSFKINSEGKVVPIFLPNVLGRHQVYAALAAVAVGIAYNFNLVEISEALKKFQSPPGRMKLIKGIKNTLIIDDSYNSSPQASLAALEVLEKAKVSGRRLAALGDMMELGDYTKEGHQEVGRRAAQVVGVLVTVGERARMIAKAAIKEGLSQDKVLSFGDSFRAGRFLQERLKPGDILLVKGSQAVRMEKIVKELMAEPQRARELLVRQDESWAGR